MIRTLRERRELERRARFSKLTFRDPEKHYVRLNGWLEACRSIKRDLPDKEFRYFSLCGREPLDVLLLFREGILTPNRKTPNVVICDLEVEALTSAAAALTRARCGPVTKFYCSVEDLVLSGGDLHRQFEETLPFHVFNLDFTKQIFYHKYPIQERMWQTIEQIIHLQSMHNQDFDLFITSRSYPKHINQGAIRILLETMNNNINKVNGLTDLMNRNGIGSFDDLFRDRFTEFFLRSLPKQILQTAHDDGFLLRVHKLFCYEKIANYSPDQHYKFDIAKWCLGFRRPQNTAPLSIGNYFARHGFDNYCETALAVVGNNILNVKDVLANDRHLAQEMRRDVENLCQLAGLPT